MHGRDHSVAQREAAGLGHWSGQHNQWWIEYGDDRGQANRDPVGQGDEECRVADSLGDRLLGRSSDVTVLDREGQHRLAPDEICQIGRRRRP